MDNTDTTLLSQEKSGKKISPVLPAHIRNYLVDIDGTVCEDIPNEEPERMTGAEMLPGALETLNKWYDEGHIITFFTSRTEEHRAVTEEWLHSKGFKYQTLLVGKPRGGNYHWIDNAPVQVMNMKEDFWKFNLSKNKAIGYKLPI
jgi:uncharacterized HAD superfamily protein